MKILYGIEQYKGGPPSVVTTGTFDGVHLGHKKILENLRKRASELGLKSIVLTFEPHPRKILFGNVNGLKMLTTLDEKLEMLEGSGVDYVIVHPFTLEFSRTTAQQYVRNLLVDGLNIRALVIGYDHQFGKNREGSIENLRELAELYDFEVAEIAARDVDAVHVSSTKARKALETGEVQTAAALLGYPYFLSATVVAGNHRGKSLGFPTANLNLNSEEKLIPGVGVYAVNVELEGQHHSGMLNIGTNPTFGEHNPLSIELHIFDFDRDIYGIELRVHFIAPIRSQQRFASPAELSHQLMRDREKALQLLK